MVFLLRLHKYSWTASRSHRPGRPGWRHHDHDHVQGNVSTCNTPEPVSGPSSPQPGSGPGRRPAATEHEQVYQQVYEQEHKQKNKHKPKQEQENLPVKQEYAVSFEKEIPWGWGRQQWLQEIREIRIYLYF